MYDNTLIAPNFKSSYTYCRRQWYELQYQSLLYLIVKLFLANEGLYELKFSKIKIITRKPWNSHEKQSSN